MLPLNIVQMQLFDWSFSSCSRAIMQVQRALNTSCGFSAFDHFPPTHGNTYKNVKMFPFRWVLPSCHGIAAQWLFLLTQLPAPFRFFQKQEPGLLLHQEGANWNPGRPPYSQQNFFSGKIQGQSRCLLCDHIHFSRWAFHLTSLMVSWKNFGIINSFWKGPGGHLVQHPAQSKSKSGANCSSWIRIC